MSTLSKLVLGAMGRLRPEPATGNSAASIALPEPERHGGLPLMEALARRHSSREFKPDPLPPLVLSALLWAAYGINRAEGGRTAPSALNAQEIDIYLALPAGAYRYDPVAHALRLASASDVRRVTGYQDFRTRRRSTWSMSPTTRAWVRCRSRSADPTRRRLPGRSRRTSICTAPAPGSPPSFGHG